MNKKGFTLIELLVVIAIIGILATIVLASLNTARQKANDVAVKSDLDNSRASAELFYDVSQTYLGVCATGGVNNAIGDMVLLASKASLSGGTLGANNAAQTAGVAACHDAPLTWVAQAQYKSTPATSWCVDSTGASKEAGAYLTLNATKCL